VKILFTISLCALLSCSANESAKYAGKRVKIYKNTEAFFYPEGDAMIVKFLFDRQDNCIFTGEETIQKMFAYSEITCPKKGNGWIMRGAGT
jgi:hypothetical protein